MKRVNLKNSVYYCIDALWPPLDQTALRYPSIDGGRVELDLATAWIAANPNLSELSFARIGTNDVRGDSLEEMYDARYEAWEDFFTVIREHPSRMLVRLTDIPGLIALSQHRHDMDATFSLVHHTSICTPQQSDEFCRMLMKYMSCVGDWKIGLTVRLAACTL